MLIDYWQTTIEADFDQMVMTEEQRILEPVIEDAIRRLEPKTRKLLEDTKSRKTIYANIRMDVVFTLTFRARRNLPSIPEWRYMDLNIEGVDVSTQDLKAESGNTKITGMGRSGITTLRTLHPSSNQSQL